MKPKTCTQKIRKANGKTYAYKKKFLPVKESFGDLLILLGPDAVLNLLRYFGGSQLYVPKSESVKRMIVEACAAEEAEKLSEQGLTRREIIDRLQKDFPGHWRSRKVWENFLVVVFGKGPDKTLHKARRECLLTEVACHKEAFRHYNII